MRIAQIAPPWLAVPPQGYGGVEWVVALLADGLTERGHDVTLFASGDSTTRARLEATFPKAPGPALINSISHDTAHTLFAFRDPSRFEVVHVHAPFSALAAAVVSGLPVVHTLHGAFTPEMRSLYSLVADQVWFVAISEAQRSSMPGLRYAGVVHNAVDVRAYPFRRDDDGYVLFLGRAAPEKGPLRAALAARAAGVRLVMAVKIADAVERVHWGRDVEPALPAGTTVLGEISLREKLELLAGARAVLFPIDWDEPFGLVMAEAMACGTPVIAASRGAVREVVVDGRTGFVVRVEDYPEAAAAALRRLGEIDRAACRAWVEERFSAEVMVGGYERVFARVVEEAPASSRAGSATS